jgi:Putative addiction module component
VQNAKIKTNPLEQNDPMLTLDQLISEATALPDAAKALLIDKIAESMTSQIDRDILMAGVQKAQERMAEIDSGAVQTIPGDIALAQIRQISQK